MNNKDLRRLSRRDLLEMLLELSKDNERLRKINEQLEQKLEDRLINTLKSDSLAEAALRLNGVFEAAQNACDQYIYNTKVRCRQMEEETMAKCSEMLREAESREYRNEAENHELQTNS